MTQHAHGPAALEVGDAAQLLGGTARGPSTAAATAGGPLQRLRAMFHRRQLPQQVDAFLDTHLPRVRGFERLADTSKLSSASSRWCPEEQAGWLSRLFFSYVDSLIAKGRAKVLGPEDLWDMAHQDEVGVVWGGFKEALDSTRHPQRAPQGLVWRAMLRCHGGTFFLAGLLKVFHDIVMFAQPALLEQLLHHLAAPGGAGGSSSSRGTAAGLAAALLGAAVLQALSINVFFHMLFRISLHLKTQLIQLLYVKSLAISCAARSSLGVGAILNLQSNDASKIWGLPTYGHVLWNGPFQILVVMAMLVRLLDWLPALAGLLVTVAVIPVTAAIGRAMSAERKKMVAATDARVKLVSEVITGVKAIKLYAWEGPYRERIQELRAAELRAIRTTQILSMVNSATYTSGPVLVSLAAFAAYTWAGHPLTAAVAFPALALFNLLRFPIIMIPTQIMNLINARIGLRRIQDFLAADEMVPVSSRCHPCHPSGDAPGDAPATSAGRQGSSKATHNGLDAATPAAAAAAAVAMTGTTNGVGEGTGQWGQAVTPAIQVQGASFRWSPEAPLVLTGVNLVIPKGALVMVVGKTGAGKSSLLAAMLGEVEAVAADAYNNNNNSSSWGPASKPLSSSRRSFDVAGAAPGGPLVCLEGRVAYTAQDPWIQNTTLRNNVLLNSPWDPAAYAATLSCCCLAPDLATLPAGDATEIGEKGVNLSGGQKHRVALARAVYAGAEVYLLDDPLSAVDAHVGAALFERCICGTLANTTRVLVTHQLQYLPRCDLVVVVDQGRVTHTGTYHQLLAQGVDLTQYSVQTQDEDQTADDQPSDQEASGADSRRSTTGDNSSGVLFSLGEEEEDGQQAHQQQQQQAGTKGVQGGGLVSLDMTQGHLPTTSSSSNLPHHSTSSSHPSGGTSSITRTAAAAVPPAGVGPGPAPASAASAAAAGSHAAPGHLAVDLLGLISDAATASDPGGSGSGAAIQAVADAAVSAGVLLGQTDDVAALVDAQPATDSADVGLDLNEGAVGGVVTSVGGDSSSRGSNVVSEQGQVQDSSSSLIQTAGHSSSSSSNGKAQPLSPASPGVSQLAEQAQSSAQDDAESETQALLKRLTVPQGQQGGQTDGQLVKAEERAKGQVTWQVYKAYLTAWGPWLLLPLALVGGAFLERTLQVLQNYVLSIWSNHTVDHHYTSPPTNSTSVTPSPATSPAASPMAQLPADHTRYYLGLYFGLGIASIGVQLARSFALVAGTVAASRRLHQRLLDKVLRLPMSFFDTQPTGRLLNRFTKDAEAVDMQLAGVVNSALNCFVNAACSLVVVLGVSPATGLAFVPLAWVYHRVQVAYISTNRELKRLDALSFSPIFHHYSESLAGLTTLRAFRQQAAFEARNQACINASNAAWWPIQVVNRWLSVRLELMGAGVVFAAALAVGVVLPLDAGMAGLALTSALNLTGIMNWMVRQVTELEVNMNSVERLVEYHTQEEEAPSHTAPGPPPGWPSAGAIEARALVVAYRAGLPPVLKGLSFSIAGRHKVGICGRTGCGKSTLMMALFRIVEPTSGALLIDGIDTSTLGLTQLRSRLSLVPQDPVIFSGSIRSNLDPFGQAGSDGELWGALGRAGVDGLVRGLGAGLDSPLQEGGTNLSTGQRQLLCMARALLRSSRILVLDEATSNVDNATDALIHKTLRSAFGGSTVLTIAHRLHTIADVDTILVLETGRVAEVGPPGVLMMTPGSAYRGLVEQAARTARGH